MAGKRKAEGIALLSLYNDDEEEEEEEEEEEVEDEEQEDNTEQEAAAMEVEENDEAMEEPLPSSNSVSPPLPPPTTSTPDLAPASSPVSSPSPPPPDRYASGAHGIIVDYAHDEVALSPEAEEGEILSTGRAVYGRDIQASNGALQGGTPPGIARVLTPNKGLTTQSDDQTDQPKVGTDIVSNDLLTNQDSTASLDVEVNGTEVVDTEASEADPLADFLPPPPATKCSDELQNKFSKYLAFKNAGRSFNEELRKSKGYRNPDFLQRAVKYQEIDQIGSCFRKEVFDPHGYDPSDFYDALALELRREMDRKEQAKKQSQRVDFVHGGVQPVPATALPDRSKPIVPILGGQKVPSALGAATANTSNSGSQVVASTDEISGKSDGRSSKKSKWDKVDGDGRAPPILPAGAKTAMAAASAHAALLTASAGAGYASFAQQKRKEAEERSRASDKSAVKSEKK